MSDNCIDTKMLDSESETKEAERGKAYLKTSDEKNTLENSMASLATESHLQSLGFVVTNGRPRFKVENVADESSSMPPSDFSMVDEDDTLSFVVLGKDSLDSIHAMTLASYVDIQRKTMSVDYDSMISPLSSTEMHRKLVELLQENTKFKETLKQNNMAMKQQFNMLAAWQEEVLKVHQNHKQKFAETRELINRFKKENAELRSELYSYRTNNSESDVPKPSDVSMLVTELARCFGKRQSLKIKDVEVADDSDNDLREMHTSIDKKNDGSCFQCNLKAEEIDKLKNINKVLEEQLRCTLTPIELPNESAIDPLNANRRQYIQNVKRYNKEVEMLSDCFAMQLNRLTCIQGYVEEITNLLETLDMYRETSENNRKMEASCMDITDLRQKLSVRYKDLLQEQLKLIDDRQNLFKAQKDFQKIVFDYNAVLCELEITMEENSKLTAIKNNIARESCQKIAELEKNNVENKQTLEERKKVLDDEKECLEEEKRSLEHKKKSLDTERKNLLSEKELVQRERVALNEEKTSLDQQSQLYENYERVLHEENKRLEARNKELLIERNLLREQLQKIELENRTLQEEVKKYEENTNLLTMQLNMYEEDFKQERKVKESLLEDSKKVDMDLQKQIKFNQELQREVSSLQGTLRGQDSQTSSQTRQLQTRIPVKYTCPNCECKFSDYSSLSNHVARCLNID